jgi:hypothetical protein
MVVLLGFLQARAGYVIMYNGCSSRRNEHGKYLVEKIVLPCMQTEIKNAFALKKEELQDALVHSCRSWPVGATTFFPFSHTLEDSSQEYQSVKTIAEHALPAQLLNEVVAFGDSLQEYISDEETTLAKARYHIDALRIHAAKVLMAVVAAKKVPCVVPVVQDDKWKHYIEKLCIPADVEEHLVTFASLLTDFGVFIVVDSSRFQDANAKELVYFRTLLEDARAWRRVLVSDVRGLWLAGVSRLLSNLEATYPADWRSFTVDQRDNKRIIDEICNNESLAKLLPCQTALKEAQTDFESAMAKIGDSSIPKDLYDKIANIFDNSKMMLGIRAASTVTLLRLPTATNLKSKISFVRECKRLIRALEITLPTAVLNAMEEAAAAP